VGEKRERRGRAGRAGRGETIEEERKGEEERGVK